MNLIYLNCVKMQMSVIIFLLFRLKLKQRYALNNEHYTALKIRGHKHLYKDCGSIFVDRFNTLDLCSKMTNRLRCKIQQLSLTKPFRHIVRDGKGYSYKILRGKVLYGQAYKTKAIFSYNKFSPTIHYVTTPSNRSSLNMIQNLMDLYKQISGADIDRLKLGLF